jgi:predicted nicotinamide N-methyase
MPETPLEAIRELIRERVVLEGRTFLIERPDGSDRLLDHPQVRSTFAQDEFLPYWADLWPAARMLAKVILRENWPPNTPVLEIGCGLGLPGIAALARGLHVTFSDCDPTALHFAARNARLNGFSDFQLLRMDWRSPPTDLQTPLLLASDLIYEARNVEPIVALMRRVLTPDGACLLTDQDRPHSATLRETLAREGLEFTTRVLHAGEPGGRRFRGTLYRIRRAKGTLGSGEVVQEKI